MLKKLIISLAFLLSLNSFASEDSEQKVKNYIKAIADNVIQVAANNNYSAKQKAAHMMNILEANFNVKWMSRFVLGASYRDLNPSQQKIYLTQYKKYLLYSYLPNLLMYQNEKYRIIKVTQSSKRDFTVETDIIRNDGKQPIRINYHVKISKNGKFKIVDIIAEGISAILSQRSEFKAIVKESGVNGLIDLLTNKNKQFDKEYS